MSLRDPQAAFSAADLGSSPSIEEEEEEDEDGRRSRNGSETSSPGPARAPEPSRHWRDVFWLLVFVLHLAALGSVLGLLGINRFRKADRFNIDRFTNYTMGNASHPQQHRRGELTETFWPFYGVAGGIGTALGWAWLSLLGSKASQMMKVSIHSLTTYLAVISVLCFWGQHVFWGIAFAVGAALQFLYVMSVLDRFPFTMLVLQKAVKMVWDLPEVMRVAYAFMIIMLCWMILWSFGVSGVVALGLDDGGRWWLLVVRWFSQ